MKVRILSLILAVGVVLLMGIPTRIWDLGIYPVQNSPDLASEDLNLQVGEAQALDPGLYEKRSLVVTINDLDTGEVLTSPFACRDLLQKIKPKNLSFDLIAFGNQKFFIFNLRGKSLIAPERQKFILYLTQSGDLLIDPRSANIDLNSTAKRIQRSINRAKFCGTYGVEAFLEMEKNGNFSNVMQLPNLPVSLEFNELEQKVYLKAEREGRFEIYFSIIANSKLAKRKVLRRIKQYNLNISYDQLVEETPEPTETLIATPTPINSESPTPSPSPSPTFSPTPTLTPTVTPTLEPTPTASSTPIPTASPKSTPTIAPTAIPSTSPTIVASPTPVETITPEVTPTHTPTSTPVSTPIIIPTATLTPTPTPVVLPISFVIYDRDQIIYSSVNSQPASIDLGKQKRGVTKNLQLSINNTGTTAFRIESISNLNRLTHINALPLFTQGGGSSQISLSHLAKQAGVWSEIITFRVTSLDNPTDWHELSLSVGGEVLDTAMFTITHLGTDLRDGGSIKWDTLPVYSSCNILWPKPILISNTGDEPIAVSWSYDGAVWVTSSSGYTSYSPLRILNPGVTGKTEFEFYPCRAGIKSSTAKIKIEIPSRPDVPAEVVPIALWAEAVGRPSINLESSSRIHISSSYINTQIPIGMGFAVAGQSRSLELTVTNTGSKEVILDSFSIGNGLSVRSAPTNLVPGGVGKILIDWNNPQSSLQTNLFFKVSLKDYPTLYSNFTVAVLGGYQETTPNLFQDLQIIAEDGTLHPVVSVFDLGSSYLGTAGKTIKYQLKNLGAHNIWLTSQSLSNAKDLKLNSSYPLVLKPDQAVALDVITTNTTSGLNELRSIAKFGYELDPTIYSTLDLTWLLQVQKSPEEIFNFDAASLFTSLLDGQFRLKGSCNQYSTLKVRFPSGSTEQDLICNSNQFDFQSSSAWDLENNLKDTSNISVRSYNPYINPPSEEKAAFTIFRRPKLLHFPEGQPLEQAAGTNIKNKAERTLVIYNTNITTAAELASYYGSNRQIPNQNLCGVPITPGLYASLEEYEGAKFQILRDCVCPIAKEKDSGLNCATATGPQLQKLSLIDHLVFIRGWPARVTFNHEDPSLDAFMSLNLFAHSDGRWGPFHVSWGRIDGVTVDSAKNLVDRAIAAEQVGLQGKIIAQTNPQQYVMRYGESPKQQCQLNLESESPWDYNNCDVGFEKTGKVPGNIGSSSSTIVPSLNIFMGSNPWPNNQNAFNADWNTLLKWRKNNLSCIALCKDFSSSTERSNCRANSKDFFREINTDCIGGTPGLIGQQIRSWPVTHLGFSPPGYDGPGDGSAESSPLELINESSTLEVNDFYVRLGAPDVVDQPKCLLKSGQEVNCPSRIPLHIWREYPLVHSAEADLNGDLHLVLTMKVRNSNPTGGKFYFEITPSSVTGGWHQLPPQRVELDLGPTRSNWQTVEIPVRWAGRPVAESIYHVAMRWQSAMSNLGFLEIDNFQLLRSDQVNLFTPEQSAFAESQTTLSSGTWATNTLERIGATAWWGSGSHYLTGGWAFSNHELLWSLFLSGSTLGEAVSSSGNIHSGLIYGDPLYQPAAARIDLRDTKYRLTVPIASAASLSQYDPQSTLSHFPRYIIRGQNNPSLDAAIEVMAFNGLENDQNTSWEIFVCEEKRDPRYCDTLSKWHSLRSGQTAIRELTSSELNLSEVISDFSRTQYLNLKIEVKAGDNPALKNYLFVEYQPE